MAATEGLREIGARVDELHAGLGDLLAAAGGPDAPPPIRAAADRLAGLLDALATTASAERQRLAAEDEYLNEVLEAIYAVAALDFSHRAEIRGEGALDALALSINMLAEELDDAQRRLEVAKASAEAATQAKTRFLAQMSHEIRTPLTALLGFADMLAVPSLNDSDRLNYAMIVRRNGDHLLSVINDILDLSKIEAQRLQLETIDCSPAMIVSDVDSLMRARASERGLEFEVRLENPIPLVLRTDPTRLRQVLLNVVGNAIKFTEKGSVRLLVRFEPDAARLRFEVVDTGIGLTSEERARLFQPFEQADLSMTRRFGGSGLGLAISKALVVALGGTIDVTSTPGEGSRFTVTLPATVTAGMPLVSSLSEVRRAAAAPVAPATKLAGTILLAEDGPDNQILVSTILRNLGLTVAVVGTGALASERALTAWRAGMPYDLVFMDMQMPVMDGYEATRRLRAAGYPGPIVALTAHAMQGELERCLGAGCNEFVRKPIERAHLLAVLLRYVAAEPVTPGAEASETPPLVSTFGEDPDMAAIVTRFVGSLPDRVAAMHTEVTAGNHPALQRLAHQLKGAAGGYGFPEITVAAAALEAVLEDGGDPARRERALEELAGLCGRARAVRT